MINNNPAVGFLKGKSRHFLIRVSVIILMVFSAQADASAQTGPPPLAAGNNGPLIYHPDEKGNRIPDFSYCGYMSGNDSIPDVPIRVIVPVKEGDATLRIQSALNYVASLPADSRGIRGAVLLEKGTYKIDGRLEIAASGVVLRGSGMGKGGTRLVAEGTSRQTLIRIIGKNDRVTGKETKITDPYVPVGADQLQVSSNGLFKVGDNVVVHRPCTEKWIHELGMKDFGGQSGWLGWKPGDEDIYWDRKITAVNGNKITLDIPLTTSLDSSYGGGTIAVYRWPGRISQNGIENLRLLSAYNAVNPKDEDHCWMAITLENAQDAWVRQVIFEHFAGSAVYVLNTARRVTVVDCQSLDPLSEIGGQRRNTFWTDGQQTLFQCLYSEYGYHDFAVGFCAPGPNAFVQCTAHLPFSFSGSINSWASGVLFDVVNIDGQALSFKNIGQDDHGAGWNAANSVFWQCSAARIDCFRPPTAENWAFGCWSEFAGQGYWGQPNEHVDPYSLYYAQLRDRLGETVAAGRTRLMVINTKASSSPTIQEAAALTALSVKPGPLLSDWIDKASQREPIPVNVSGVKTIDQIGYKVPPLPRRSVTPMQIENGWLVRGGEVLTGKEREVPWWRGDVQPNDIKAAQPAITRYVPGRNGWGVTDNLTDVISWMKDQHVIALDQHYGLWYDCRRDDHERVRRINGDVWPPFYELPFARSGKDTAWDGLSKYDLTKYNAWYWNRLKDFADLADQNGQVLIHENYFQHNIIEAGAHWVDCPWRPVNNINHTGFPEPPPFAGDKRIFMAEQFYDEINPVRRKLHEAYIRKCLDNFQDNTGVIQLTAAEFTGPLHFARFWIDVIAKWEKEKNKKECIGLSVTKDVQDSILADRERVAIVNVIDIRYWYYEANGALYAPKGGQSLAPRQQQRIFHPKRSSFEQVYRAVREYRDKYPGKAIMYSADGFDRFGWAVFMAGGSLAAIPPIAADGFLKDAAKMRPADLPGHPDQQWALTDKQNDYIIYDNADQPVQLDLSGPAGRFLVHYVDPKNGQLLKQADTIRGGIPVDIKNPQSGPVIILLTHS